LRIDAQLLRLQHAVAALADLTGELARLVELEQARSAVRHGARRAQRDRRIAGACVDVDVALGIGGDAGDFAKVQTRRQRENLRGGERNLGNLQLRRRRGGCCRERRDRHDETKAPFHDRLLSAGRRSWSPVSG
jgi:hypothetical protein